MQALILHELTDCFPQTKKSLHRTCMQTWPLLLVTIVTHTCVQSDASDTQCSSGRHTEHCWAVASVLPPDIRSATWHAVRRARFAVARGMCFQKNAVCDCEPHCSISLPPVSQAENTSANAAPQSLQHPFILLTIQQECKQLLTISL